MGIKRGGFQFTAYVAEQLRHEAVCHHLGLMTPNEVKNLRQKYTYSQSEFSRVTRIGEASLSRWETGQLTQNAAYDQLLYLLTFSDNLERLRERAQQRETRGASASSRESASRSQQVAERRVRRRESFAERTP